MDPGDRGLGSCPIYGRWRCPPNRLLRTRQFDDTGTELTEASWWGAWDECCLCTASFTLGRDTSGKATSQKPKPNSSLFQRGYVLIAFTVLSICRYNVAPKAVLSAKV